MQPINTLKILKQTLSGSQTVNEVIHVGVK